MNPFMKKGLLALAALVVIVIACNKDNYQTKPSLKLKSLSGENLAVNSPLYVVFEFTDKEGDVNDTLYVRKLRLNKRVVPTLRDSFRLKVPDFPKNSKGTISFQMDYQNYLISAQNPPTSGNPPKAEPDTLIMKFVLKDKAGNVSDTVTTGQIIIAR